MAKRVKSNRTWRRISHWLGPVQRERLLHNVWLELVVVASVVLVSAATYGAANILIARHHNLVRQSEALILIHEQIQSLQESNGLAAAEQCFDTTGTPRVSTDVGAPCSYTPKGKPGCLSAAAVYCYEVHIAKVTPAFGGQPEQPVTYQVKVSWSGKPVERGAVAANYRVVESNSAYAAEHTGRSGSGGPGTDATIGVANGVVGGVGTTLGGKFINTLADIPGGPSVSISAAECSGVNDCVAHKGSYDLTGHFAVSTNIPDKLIASCTWDFGDGTPVQQVTSIQMGCLNDQIINHSYADTWQMQPVPPYPLACPSPLGTSLDAYTFLVSVTLHTTSGVDVSSASPHSAAMPSCST